MAGFNLEKKGVTEMTETLDRLLSRRRGYRTESVSGSGVRDLMDIIRYEVIELRNSQTLEYCHKKFDMVGDIPDPMSEESDEILEIRLEAWIYELWGRIGEKYQYALWLTTKDNVKEFYDGTDEDIDEYYIKKNWIVLDDGGVDGILFAMPKRPEPVSAYPSYLYVHSTKDYVIGVVDNIDERIQSIEASGDVVIGQFKTRRDGRRLVPEGPDKIQKVKDLIDPLF